MFRSALLVVVILFAIPLHAQEKQNAQEPPHKIANVPHFNRKAFIAGVALLAAGKTADAITTRQLLDRGGVEYDPLFGRHPPPAKQSLVNLGFFAAESASFYLTEHSRVRWISWTGRAFPSQFHTRPRARCRLQCVNQR